MTRPVLGIRKDEDGNEKIDAPADGEKIDDEGNIVDDLDYKFQVEDAPVSDVTVGELKLMMEVTADKAAEKAADKAAEKAANKAATAVAELLVERLNDKSAAS